jgi:protein SCO1
MTRDAALLGRAGALLLGIAIALCASAARAHEPHSMLQPAQTVELVFHQHMGAELPLGTRFRDSLGRSVRLGEFFHGEPVVMVLEYLRCRTLCGVVIQDAAQALANTPLKAGRDYQVIALSIDPRDGPADARAARAKYLASLSTQAAQGWHFLTGSAASIHAVASVVGFPYRYDPELDQYAHPAGITIATPAGGIARYILGVGYRPLDVRLALTEAADGHISSPVADLLLLCYCYDPGTGRYSFAIRDTTDALCGATVLGIALLVVFLTRASSNRTDAGRPDADAPRAPSMRDTRRS